MYSNEYLRQNNPKPPQLPRTKKVQGSVTVLAMCQQIAWVMPVMAVNLSYWKR